MTTSTIRVRSSGLSECAGCARVRYMRAPIFNLRALRGPPFLLYAFSQMYEIFFVIVFLLK